MQDRFEEDPNGHWIDEGFFEGLSSFDKEDVIYNVERMDREFVGTRSIRTSGI